ncbi:TetR/AcrR family transcriptional regulator [Halieaceae bacterium IMCC14734]|uniref:TetR/AcrR family transcriptional regulator n=2 Tax=Candidatus Litorirhabdus singularis TaxID=2518993 RepID=A0ABT3TF48_9GAMM|nr:TetR/AcrR family transcriptional regulator [Candidatus Litorirhabdus singularis]
MIDATLELMEEGVLIPTAQLISERAGVGIRSFFRHFADMESLFIEIDQQTRESSEALFIGGDREGTTEKRILHAVERRADGYEDQKNTILCVAALSWKHSFLRENYAHYQRALRKDLDDWLPELKKLPRARREAIDALASFEMWHRLRSHQGLGKKQAIKIVVEMISEAMAAS